MDTAFYQEIAASNLWGTILPEILLVLLGLSLLVLEFTPVGRSVKALERIAVLGLVGILIAVLAGAFMGGFGATTTLFGGMIRIDPGFDVIRVFFLLAGIFTVLLAGRFLQTRAVPKSEYFAILLFVLAAMMLLAASSHFLMFFVALETVTIGFYILVSYLRAEVFSLEAGLKYLILGALSSAILLMGVALLYGASGMPGLPGRTTEGMDFEALGAFIAANPANPLVLTGTVLVLCGICFKIGAVPFQIWIPDVYQGAPLPTTAMLAVASKGAGFLALLNLVQGPFHALGEVMVPLLAAIAVVTIAFGNLAALTQRNVRRVIGLSGIAHAGYLLLGVTATYSVEWAASAVLLYLFIYLFASFGLFGVVSTMDDRPGSQNIDGYSELAARNPFLGFVLVVSIGSLAGIPPLAGFIGKFFLFVAAYQAGLFLPLAVALLGVVVSIYYYFGWIREAVFRVWRAPGEAAPEVEASMVPGLSFRVVLGFLAIATVFFGLFQKPLTQLVGL